VCGINVGGWGLCWGIGLGLGNGGISRDYPDSVHLAVQMTKVVSSVAQDNACAVGSDQAIYCWGEGALGDGSAASEITYTPVIVSGGHSFDDVGVGNLNACGLATNGAAYCWGDNRLGAIGDGTVVDRGIPTLVSGGLAFTQLATGTTHSCGLVSGGTAYCWGDNYFGELGIGVSARLTAPVKVQ
jgi:alpha-tubulin suppressor-like RCC1 family protein